MCIFKALFWPRCPIGPAPLQKCVGNFCGANFGGFCRGFSWMILLGTFSPTKMRRTNQVTKSAKSGGPKIKIANNPFCRNPTLRTTNTKHRRQEIRQVCQGALRDVSRSGYASLISVALSCFPSHSSGVCLQHLRRVTTCEHSRILQEGHHVPPIMHRSIAIILGNAKSAQSFLTHNVFLETYSGHGHPRLWVKDVRARNSIFLRSK